MSSPDPILGAFVITTLITLPSTWYLLHRRHRPQIIKAVPKKKPTPQAKPESASQVNPEGTSQSDPEATSQANPESTSQANPESTSQADPEQTAQAKSEQTAQAKSEQTASPPAKDPPPIIIPRPPFERILTFLVHLHTLLIVYRLIVEWPPNLFTALGLPMTAPTEQIRHAFLRYANMTAHDSLPKALENLIAKLGNVEMRLAYIRFGQTVIQDCTHCKTTDQYALFALPGPALQYILEAVLVALLTVERNGRTRWRTIGIVAVGAAALGEAYLALTVKISLPRNGRRVIMWHDMLYLVRQLFFLFLPIFISYLPPGPEPVSMRSLLESAHNASTSALNRANLVRYLQPALMRESSALATSSSWWADQKLVGDCIREDDSVWRAIQNSQSNIKGENKPAISRTDLEELRVKAKEEAAALIRALQ